MPDAAPALLIDPLGRPQTVAPDEVAGALASGYEQPSPEQAQAFDVQQKYGGTASQLKTALTGAGDVLTFGGASALRKGLGASNEQLRGEEQANPISHAAGELAGFGASALVPGLGEATAPGLIGKLGAGVAEHVVPAAAAKALTGAAGAGAKALRGAVALGTEGAAYGAQQVAHEALLGDPALTAESAVATVLGSALAGGVLGGGAGVLGHLAGGVSASSIGERVSDMAKEAEGYFNLNATDAMPAEIKAVIKRKGDAAAIGREGRDLGIIVNPRVDSTENILERAEAAAKAAGEQVDKLAADAAAAGAPVTNFAAIRQQVEAPIVAALRKQGATYGLADQFAARMDQYAQAYAGRDLDLPGVLGLKRDLGQFIYTNKSTLDVWAREINTPLSRALQHVSGMVEDGVKGALGKDALAELLAANRKAEVALTFKTLAESGIARAAANNPVHLSGMMGAVAGASALGPAGLALGAASELARRRGASASGYLLRGLTNYLDGTATVALRAAAGTPIHVPVPQVQGPVRGRPVPPLHAVPPAAASLNSPLGRAAGAAFHPTGNLAGAVAHVPAPKIPPWQMAAPAGPAMRPHTVPQTPPLVHGDEFTFEFHPPAGALPADTLRAPAWGMEAPTGPAAKVAVNTPQNPPGVFPPAGVAVPAAPKTTAAAIDVLAKNNARLASKIKTATLAAVKGGGEVSPTALHDAATMYEKRVNAVRAAAAPDKMAEDITAHTQGMHDHAPQTAAQYGVAHARAVQYLASQIPPTIDRGILAPTQQPTASQMRKFNAAYEAVTDPLSVVHAAAAGQASPQTIAVLAQVYPAMHKAVAAAALEHIARVGVAAVPRSQHAALQALTGERLNASVSGQQILRTQQALAAQPQAPHPAGRPLGAAKALTLGARALTQSQASATRR